MGIDAFPSDRTLGAAAGFAIWMGWLTIAFLASLIGTRGPHAPLANLLSLAAGPVGWAVHLVAATRPGLARRFFGQGRIEVGANDKTSTAERILLAA